MNKIYLCFWGMFFITLFSGCGSTPKESQLSSSDEIRELKQQVADLQKVVAQHAATLERGKVEAPKPQSMDVAPESLPKKLPQKVVTPKDSVSATREEKEPVATAQPEVEKAKSNSASNSPLVGIKEKSTMDQWGEEKLFQTAFNLRKTHPQESSTMFARFIKQYSKSALADNALFWLGVIQYEGDSAQKALVFWDKILRDYPTSNKRSDALYMMSAVYRRLNQHDKAQRALDMLLKDHPHSRAAKLARNNKVKIQEKPAAPSEGPEPSSKKDKTEAKST